MAGKLRIGIGHDVHRFVTGRQLVLGGVEVPFEKGLDGWSDADALIHAVIDALFGAAGIGDIGRHYPSGVEEYRDISSLLLLKQTGIKLAERGWQVSNIDASIIAEQPRLSGFVDQMCQEMSRVLGIPAASINVKAGTTEGLGFTGIGEGIEVLAVAMIEST